jgi:hypothetical protein
LQKDVKFYQFEDVLVFRYGIIHRSEAYKVIVFFVFEEFFQKPGFAGSERSGKNDPAIAFVG